MYKNLRRKILIQSGCTNNQLFCRRLRLRVARVAIEKPQFDEFMKLNGDSKRRYLLEIASIDGVESVDPYSLKGSDFFEDTSVLPPLRSELSSIFCLFCIGFRFICFTRGNLLLYISLLAIGISQFTCYTQQA